MNANANTNANDEKTLVAHFEQSARRSTGWIERTQERLAALGVDICDKAAAVRQVLKAQLELSESLKATLAEQGHLEDEQLQAVLDLQCAQAKLQFDITVMLVDHASTAFGIDLTKEQNACCS